MKQGSIDWSLLDANRRPLTHDTRSQTVWHPTNTMNLYRIPNFHSAFITPILLQWEWCRPLLRRLQQMLPHFVLVKQAVPRLFSICKRCGKGNCEKAAVGSRGGPVIAVKFCPGGPIILPWTVRGGRFRGGTVHCVTVAGPTLTFWMPWQTRFASTSSYSSVFQSARLLIYNCRRLTCT